MRVLHVSCGGLGNGGVQKVIMNICENIPNIKFDIILFTKYERFYDKKFLQMGGNIFRIPHYEGKNKIIKKIDYFIRFPRIFNGVYRVLKEQKYDAIHCHNYFEGGICTMAAKIAGVPIRICHSHSAVPKQNINFIVRFYNIILKYIISKTANIKIACSLEASRYLFGIRNDVRIIKNAIDLKQFDNKLYKHKKNENIVFINIGRYCKSKNQLFLLDVFNKIKSEISNVELLLIGFGEDENKIRNKIIEMNLDNCVKMMPSNSNIPLALSKSDYLIFPSIYEGFGIVLLEAQAMEVKCFVSSNIPNEANVGLCKFLDLSYGADKWAKLILEDIYRGNGDIDLIKLKKNLLEYDIDMICKEYENIYYGE